MFGFNIRTRLNVPDSPRPKDSPKPVTSSPKQQEIPGSATSPRNEVGEIDTRPPFQSVKAAVSLFGDAGASPKLKGGAAAISKKPTKVEERVLEKETQLHLAMKELDSSRARLRVTESTKAQALRELEKASRTLKELTRKLEIVSESKQTAIEATDTAKQRATELEQQKTSREQLGADAQKSDVDSERELYKASASELIATKQELTNLRQDFDVALEAKLAASQQAVDAQQTAQHNQDRVTQLSREISDLREAHTHVKLACLQTQQEQEKHDAETLARLQSHKKAKETVDNNINSLEQQYGPELDENLEEKLEGTAEAIKVLQEQLNNVRESDQSAWSQATSELDGAKKKMQEILEEIKPLQSWVDALKLELDNVKQENFQLKSKASDAETAAESLQTNLQISKTELEAALAGKIDPKETSDMQIKIQELLSEVGNATRETEEINKNVAVLKEEAKVASIAGKNAEERLQIALKELEEAKAAERRAGEVIHGSTKSDAAQDWNSGVSGKIKLSQEDFESLNKKVEESSTEADIKVATVMAQIETIEKKESEAVKQLETSKKEEKELEAAIQEALKQADQAEAAKQMVESELRKWREKDVVGESSHSHEDTN